MTVYLKRILQLLPAALLFSNVVLAGDTDCLDESERVKFFVEPLEPVYKAEDGREGEVHEQRLGEAQILEGLASFLEARAKAELKAWVIDDLFEKLCNGKKGNMFFPDTCSLNPTSSRSYADISNNYDALVTVLRKDFQNIPACTLSLKMQSHLPYYFQSIYEQNKLGIPLEYLFYSLASKQAFYGQCRLKDGKLNTNCKIVLPILLYASALDAAIQDEATQENLNKYNIFIKSLDKRLEKLNKQVEDKIKKIDALTAEQSESYLNMFSYLMDYSDKNYQFDGNENASRDMVSNHFVAGSDKGIKQLALVSMLVKMGSQDSFEDLSPYVELIRSAMRTHAYVEAREYTKANLELIAIVNTLPKDTDCKTESGSKTCNAIEALHKFTKVSGTIATLAEAKDKDDFEQKLEALSSPIGAWKRRYEGSFSSINAFFGLAYEDAKYESPAFDSVDNSELVTFAPIGVQKTWTNGEWAWGGFISLLDLGNLVNSPETLKVDGGVIESDVESEFDKVFSPGLYFTLSNRAAPITYGLGYSQGPNGYRTFVNASGNETAVDKASSVSLFIAVDLALFPL